MKIININNNIHYKANNLNNKSLTFSKLKTLNSDVVSFKAKPDEVKSNKFLNPDQLRAKTEDFTQRLIALRKSDSMSLENARALIKDILPGVNVTVKSIEDIREVPGLGDMLDPESQKIFGVFNPEIDRATGELKFTLYYDLSNSEKPEDRDIKFIAQVHEFVHLLQAITEKDYKLTKTALSYPAMAQLSYPQLSGIFHAVEYNLYNRPDMSPGKYPALIKDFVDNYYCKSDTVQVLEFIMVKAFDEYQAHSESLRSIKNELKPANITPESPYQIVEDTAPIYKNLAKAALKILKVERADLLKDKDHNLIAFYQKELF